MSFFGSVSRISSAVGRKSRDLNAIEQSFKQGSPMPIVKRIGRKQWMKTSGGLMNRLFK